MFSRGLERREIFAANRDREHFLQLVEEMRRRYRVRIHAWVLKRLGIAAISVGRAPFRSVTLRELGAVAGGKADSAVGTVIRRFDLRSKSSGILRRRKQSLLEMLDVKP